jgi:uncharacterized repeat protein (TIGR03833 family)
METQYLKNLKKGQKVEILTEQNRLSRGVIDDILSRSSYQMYGIKVRLKSGEIGKVQKILTEEDRKIGHDDDIGNILKKGEGFHTEFKSSILWSQNYTEEDIKKSRSLEVNYYKQKASRIIISKSIAAFLNSDGGNLIIGVREKKEGGEMEIIGVYDEFKKLKDPNKDGYKRMIIDEVIRPYFPSKISNHLNSYIDISYVEFDSKILCLMKIKKSDIKVFLKLNDKEIFMIRIDTENRILEGEKLVDYCIKHWNL